MADFDIIIRGGTILDGSGEAPFVADVAIKTASSARSARCKAAVGKRSTRPANW